jgi:YHS domain-containing protein
MEVRTMDLIVLEATPDHVRAGYACPCGCRPSVEYARGAGIVDEGCCCGNHFAVGPHAAESLAPKTGFRPEQQLFDTPWGERLEAAWLVGPSVHGPSDDHDHHADDSHDHGHGRGHGHEPVHGAATDTMTSAIDPVCGMTVDRASARAKGLLSTHNGVEYFFCGKGCKLDFEDDPERYFDPDYVPSM